MVENLAHHQPHTEVVAWESPLLQGVPDFIVRREGQPLPTFPAFRTVECGDVERPDCTVKVDHLQIPGRGRGGGEMGKSWSLSIYIQNS